MSTTGSGSARRRPFLNAALPRTAVPPGRARAADKRADRLLTVVLLVLGAGLSALTIFHGTGPHDEGLMLQAGSRIASGQWPYRDFWTNYPPGQPLVLAALQSVFGASLLTWRVLRVALDGIVAVLAFRLARRHTSEPVALLVWLAVAGAMAFPTGPHPNAAAIALAFGALLIAPRRPVAGGALAGLCCLFRIEIGIATALGVVIAAPRGRRLQAASVAAAVALLTLAPFFVVAPGAMLHDLFGFYGIQGLQRLPFPIDYHGPLHPIKLFEFYFPLILVLGTALWVVAIAVRTRAAAQAKPALHTGVGAQARPPYPDTATLSLAPLAFASLVYLLGRADEFHLFPLSAVLAVMLAVAAVAATGALRAALLIALALIALNGLARQGGEVIHPPALADVPGSAGDGVQTDRADAQSLRGLERTISRLTRTGEPIFVANPRHDIVKAGDPLLYVILGHPNPTRYDVMQPGLVTTAKVQREIVASLERSHTRIVVRWLDPRATAVEHDGADRSSGVHVLDAYLATHFRVEARFGDYEVLVRSALG